MGDACDGGSSVGLVAGSRFIPLSDPTFGGVISQICDVPAAPEESCTLRDVRAGDVLAVVSSDGLIVIGTWRS